MTSATTEQVQIVVRKDGTTCLVYCERMELACLGQVHIRRASHVEPDDLGRWWADLSPVAGPVLGPFIWRSDALIAEVAWLQIHLIDRI